MNFYRLAALLAWLAAPALAARPDVGVMPMTIVPSALQPARAYILMRVSTAKSGMFRISPVLVRVPSEPELAAYRSAKEQAYRAALPRLTEKAHGKPVPTIDEYPFDYMGRANALAVDTGKFIVDGAMRTILLDADPGRYVIYGATLGTAGLVTCNCLGSVSFDASAGVITDIGSVFADKVHKPSPLTPLESNIGPTMFQYGFIFGMALQPATAQSAVPPAIAALSRRLATFEVVQPYHEPGAGSINRLAPIPGILEYRHGRPIAPPSK